MIDTTYTIQMASKLSGVGVHTIRAWEKRYKALEPSRDSSGHRSYSKSDIEKLILLSELCLLGYTISKVAKRSIPELKELLKDLGKSEESFERNEFNLVEESTPSVDTDQSMTILYFALKNFNLDVINLELTKLKNHLSSRDFALKVIEPFSRQLDDVLSNQSRTSQEVKSLEAILKFHMGHHLYHSNAKRDKNNINAVICGVEDSYIDKEITAVGHLCNYYGIQYNYLGSNLPYDVVSSIVNSLHLNLVVLGVPKKDAHQTQTMNFLDKLLNKIPSNGQVILYGNENLNLNQYSSKQVISFGSLERVDEYLSKKKL